MNRKQRDANRQTAREARHAIARSDWFAGRTFGKTQCLMVLHPWEPRMHDPSVVGRRARAHLAEIFGTSSAPDPLPAKILLRATPLDIVPGPFLMAWDESDRPVKATTIAAEDDVVSFRYIDAPAKEPT